ncbi:hypothetical protein [Pseudonocardia sp. N23]|uniref:hypothetical protein n=1 Tax=Pseudonocardia sp. N23 TaxID=1987376 RepID=UPI000BFD6FB7|nr:hypothetical protein [Pseudonocardia sp. N23]GAY12755.1 hypothetical protein TOK_1305 [Pseudonocardia sp. N23]
MNATVTPPVTATAQPEPPEAPQPARRHPAVRLAALLVGAGIAIVCATTVHVALAVGLLTLAGALWMLDSRMHDHRTGKRPLDEAGFVPAPSFTGTAPTDR